MRCAVAPLVLVLAACTGAPSGTDDASAPIDAAADARAPSDGGVDAPGHDAWFPVDAFFERPDELFPLHPACDTWRADPDDRTTYDTRTELAVALAEAQCRWGVRCNDTYRVIWCDPLNVQPGFLEPRIDLDRAERCLRAWHDTACPIDGGSIETPIFACAGLAYEHGGDGDPCTENAQCLLACDNPTGATCAGTCGPYVPWTCPFTCRPDQICRADGCIDPLAEGAPCGPTDECIAGTTCRLGQCRAMPAEGEACIPPSESFVYGFCASGFVCDEDRVCRAPHVVAVGDACSVSAACPAGSYCTASERVCRALGAAAGDACPAAYTPTFGPPPLRCAAPMYCAPLDASGGACRPRHAPGELCDADDACADPDHACLAVAQDASGVDIRRCVALAGPGCACDVTTLCPPSFLCHEGTCQRVGTFRLDCGAACSNALGACFGETCSVRFIGDPCGRSAWCNEGRCSSTTGSGTCIPFAEDHAYCATTLDCAQPEECSGHLCRIPESRAPCRTP